MPTPTRTDPYAAGRADGVPEGESGPWRVSKFTVSDSDAKMDALRAAIGGHGRSVPPGDYTRLTRNGYVVMSDTPDELRDHAVLARVGGRVIVNGLGLGCGVRMALADHHRYDGTVIPGATHIDVVEISEDVIALTGPTFDDDPRVVIHHADAFTMTWPTGTRWDFAWHDVWDDISSDNLRGEGSYAALHRKYGRRVDTQASWAFELAKAQERRGGWR